MVSLTIYKTSLKVTIYISDVVEFPRRAVLTSVVRVPQEVRVPRAHSRVFQTFFLNKALQIHVVFAPNSESPSLDTAFFPLSGLSFPKDF